jgi:rare lipoprotein A
VTRVLILAIALAAMPDLGAVAEPVSQHPLGAIGAFFDRLFHGARPAPARPEVHYVVGPPYPLEGTWQYPREQFSYDETGIANVYPPGHPALTADGEAFDPKAMAAAHRTLQLPAIARITDLDNGRQVLVRINDRGQSPARLVTVTPEVARLLQFGPASVAPVRVELDRAMSQALAQELPGGSALPIAAAPRGAVQAAPLPPPGSSGGKSASAAAMAATSPAPTTGADAFAHPEVPLRLPPTVTQAAALQPGALWVECDSFTRVAFAERERAKLAGLGAELLRRGSGGGERITVRIGPIGSIAEADAVLNRVLRAGVASARIIVVQE